MIKIAIFCVSYQSEIERDAYLSSIDTAIQNSNGSVSVDIFVADNTIENNPGYFGAVKQLMENVNVTDYEYSIISNVDLVIEKDFFIKLANYKCPKDIGWIAPQIWSNLEKRDRNPKILNRYSRNKLNILKAMYKYPILDTLYTHTLYRRKETDNHPIDQIYSGHGSFIILTREYFKQCGKIDYPVFLFCEEIYLAEKCQNARLRVMYVPNIKVFDSEHASTSKMGHKKYCRCNYEAIQYIIKTFY